MSLAIQDKVGSVAKQISEAEAGICIKPNTQFYIIHQLFVESHGPRVLVELTWLAQQ